MRIATKISVGYGTLALLMALVVAYQSALIYRLEPIQGDRGSNDLRAAETSIAMLLDLDGLQRHMRESDPRGARDPVRTEQRADLERAFAAGLERLSTIEISPSAREEVERLNRFWRDYSEASARQPAPSIPGPRPDEMAEHFDRLTAQTKSVYQALLRGHEARLQNAGEAARRARWVSSSSVAIALVLGVLAWIWIVRSIAQPLRQLTLGTRALTEGKFFYRLDTSRRDELGQLARDFNELTDSRSELEGLRKSIIGQTAGRLDRRSEDVGALVERAVGDLSAASVRREARIELDPATETVCASCDRERMLEVLRDILEAALERAPRGSVVTAALRLAPAPPEGLPAEQRRHMALATEGAGYALVSVADRGPRVSEADRERVCTRVRPTDGSRSTPGGGAGPGLALACIVAEAQDGAIWAEDNPAGGCVFRFIVPLAPAPPRR